MSWKDVDWARATEEFKSAEPFNHIVIDNFFEPEIAEQISKEFPGYEGTDVIKYKNALEDKRTLNQWDKFPPTTYRIFDWLGKDFVSTMRVLTGDEDLSFDYGLNGGGWHMHGRGGNNNIHLDYNIHPKLSQQRKINIIVYMTEDWKPEWGGGLQLWSHDAEANKPGKLVKTVDNLFNRAIIFDTTQNSWHGLPNYIECPENVVRKSIAGYYVRPAPAETENRGRALFAPREDQIGNSEVEELIRKRANVNQSSEVYRK